jgi:hypothetical protein
MLLPGLYKQLTTAPAAAAVQKLLAQPVAGSIFINAAVKQPPRPHLVLNLVSAPPAGSTLDGVSDLIDGEIQFDSYADTPQLARQLSLAVRDYWLKTFGAGQLPDGTNIQFVDVTVDHDEPREQGGGGYLDRSLLRLRSFYTEVTTS